jgi:hypothetical protein
MINNLSDLIITINNNYNNENELITIKDIINKYNGNDWKNYVIISDDLDKNYIKNLVYENNNYELFIISWMINKESTIHDHAANGCIFKILNGKIIEERYDKDTLDIIKTNIYNIGDISYINNNMNLLHKIINNNYNISVSLHIYSPPRYKINTFNNFLEKS